MSGDGICDCLDSKPIDFFVACCFPCLQFGRNVDNKDGKGHDTLGVNLECGLYCLASMFGLCCIVHYPVREEIKPDEEPAVRCLITACLPCCALIQEAKLLGAGGGMLGSAGRAPTHLPSMKRGRGGRSRGGSSSSGSSSSGSSYSY
jgi:hypothetical protein